MFELINLKEKISKSNDMNQETNAKDLTENDSTNISTSKATFNENSTENQNQTDKQFDSPSVKNDTDKMRVLLPMFIKNEQVYSQTERARKIQSSPAKSVRRFSQEDSVHIEKLNNVSINDNIQNHVKTKNKHHLKELFITSIDMVLCWVFVCVLYTIHIYLHVRWKVT